MSDVGVVSSRSLSRVENLDSVNRLLCVSLTVNFQNYFLLFVFAFLFAAEIDSAYFVFALWLFAILRRCAYCSFALKIDSVNSVLCIGVDCCPPDVR